MLADSHQFRLAFDAMLEPDPAARMRAADTMENITRRRPDLLQGLEDRLLTDVAAINQPEVRCHVAKLLPRLTLDDDSRIVRTFAMQALGDLAEHDVQMRRWVRPLLAELTRTGTPAMRSRGHTLLARREQPAPSRRPAGRTGGGMTPAGEDAKQ